MVYRKVYVLQLPEEIDRKVGWQLYELGIVVAVYSQERQIHLALPIDQIEDLRVLLQAFQQMLEA